MTNKLGLILIGSFLIISSGCSNLLKRHASSGYTDQLTRSPSGHNVIYKTYKQPLISDSVSLSDSETLKSLESGLLDPQEVKQYYYYKPLLKTDEQRIQFLRQSGLINRNNFAQNTLFNDNSGKFSNAVLNLISRRDIAVGMSKMAVLESWGKPTTVKYAGPKLKENEMWQYQRQVATSSGFVDQTRQVYFEAGHVAGWETNN